MQSEQQHPEAAGDSYPSTPADVRAPGAPEVEPDDLDDAIHDDAGPTDAFRDDQSRDDDQVLVLESWQVALPATGDDQVDAALARLADVEGLAPAAHPELYDAVHRDLRAALADLDQG